MMCANKVPDNWKMGSQKTFFLSILNKGISINILIVYYTEIESIVRSKINIRGGWRNLINPFVYSQIDPLCV